MAGRPSSLKAFPNRRESHRRNLEKNSQKPIKNTKNMVTRLVRSPGTKADFSSLRRASVSPGRSSTKIPQSSFLKKRNEYDCENVAWESAYIKGQGVSGVHYRASYPGLSVCRRKSQRSRTRAN